MNTCIYDGWVRHRRYGGSAAGTLRHPLFMAYLDLEELPEAFDGQPLFSARTGEFAVARFARRDHLGDPSVPLIDSVRALVEQRTGSRPGGSVQLLTHLSYFGYCFNPVSFYYCRDEGERIAAVVAEVTNTPWGERHAYVLGPQLEGSFAKQLHVSPFMGMDHTYSWKMSAPGPELSVEIVSEHASERVFDATLSMRRQPLSARVLARHPLMTQRVAGAIYAHGLRLKLRGARYFPNPTGTPPLGRRRRDRARSSREQVPSSC
ncbi:MAG: DUF1365 domain-containing protein [Solirubrobacteraceae bacterium]